MFRRVLLVAMAAVGVLAAQDPPSSIGRLSYIQGSVSFQPGGVDEWVPATLNRPLTIGDQVFSDEGARAEIHIPGAAFQLGSRTAFQFLNLDDQNVQVKLSEGPLIVRVREMESGNVEIDTPNAAFTISSPGTYRIDTYPDSSETYITARTGEGQVNGNGGSFVLHAREQAVVSGQDESSQFQVYDAPELDAFDDWAMSRQRRADRRVSSRYVSPYVVGAEDLDDYGDWRSNPEYGEVWIPRATPAGWAPYQYGHWAWIDPWGWTWVDDAPWGFAPFHYGRWAYLEGGWGWVPSPLRVRPVYAPALVAWIGGGGFSVGLQLGQASVGWFPLGPRDVYMPAYRASPTYVNRVNVTNTTVINTTTITNVYNNYVQTGNVQVTNYANRSVPGAVVVVPQNSLASARPVQQAVTRIQPNQLSMINTAQSAPRVVPQVAAVLGRPASAGANVPRPPVSVTSRPVVAKSAPPPPPPSFQQRSARLAQDPGRPIPIQEQRQITRSAPAAAPTPPVHVIAPAPSVAPAVSRAPAPPPGTAAARPVPPAASQGRGQAPAAQPPVAQPQVPARVQAQPARPGFEPPTAQPAARPGEPAPVRPSNPVPPPQARPVEPQAKPVEPPARPAYQPPPQARPVEPQAKPVEPPARPAYQPPPQARPVEPQARPIEPQRPAREAAPPTPPPAQPRSYEPPSRPPFVVHGQQPESERRVPPPPPERRAEPQRRPAPPPPAKDEKKDEKK